MRSVRHTHTNQIHAIDSSTLPRPPNPTARMERDSLRCLLFRAAGVSPMTCTSAILTLVAILMIVQPSARAPSTRRPANDSELRYWLTNMVAYHRFTTQEVCDATGLAPAE